MAFTKLSKDLQNSGYLLVNNFFITSFMPKAPENAVKVYLEGLYYSNLNEEINSIEHFCIDLDLTKEQVIDSFKYWEEQGLIKISNIDNLEIIYLPIDSKTIKFKPIDEEKYGDFFILCQNLLERTLTPNEFKDYVYLIEKEKIEPEALLMIIKYCTETKDKLINASYILTVCKNWINEKILTTKKVEEKIKQLELTSENILNILKILGIDRKATIEERDMYLNWTKNFHYTDSCILYIAESLNKKGGMKNLDNKIFKYHNLGLYSTNEIEDFNKNKKHYTSLAKDICTNLGLYFENLEPVIDTYLTDWLVKGFSDETLKILSKFCFKTSNSSLEKMDTVLSKLYKQGLVSMPAITQYINDLNEIDNNIKGIFEVLGLARIITPRDRELYNTWCNDWKIPPELLSFAVQISQGKSQPFMYLSKVVSNFHEKNIVTLEQAKNEFNNSPTQKLDSNINMNKRSYTDEELNRLFDNLKEIDV